MRLHGYLRRMGLDESEPHQPDIATLRRWHTAHRETFLFENLTIQSGGRIDLAIDALERKFLDEGRGGYCFEHNTLFAAALKQAGFTPVTLLGRVRRGPPERWCRTHMVLRVEIGSDIWLADVGFGGLGLLEPIPLRDGATSMQGGLEYALRRDRHLWILAMRDARETIDLYEFSEDPQTPWDVEVANHFTATHPDSVFRRTLTIQRTTGDDRIMLRSTGLTRYRAGRISEQPVDRAALDSLARELFGIALPGGPLLFETAEGGLRPNAANCVAT
jgi:N-hydroxyarylamine O-acetyltransferase